MQTHIHIHDTHTQHTHTRTHAHTHTRNHSARTQARWGHPRFQSGLRTASATDTCTYTRPHTCSFILSLTRALSLSLSVACAHPEWLSDRWNEGTRAHWETRRAHSEYSAKRDPIVPGPHLLTLVSALQRGVRRS
jgi:hypothetical protein